MLFNDQSKINFSCLVSVFKFPSNGFNKITILMNTSRKRAHSCRGVKGDKGRERDLGRNLASPRQRISNICQRTDIFPRSLSQIHTILHVKRAIAYTDARNARVRVLYTRLYLLYCGT